ncbi:F-actin-uncapping protein LRRC16A-like isoform X2 [Physella acuta]|uniref:F-actin-uncapping protein LRRC16A-like isoform X2 n=1 Tax=Physella acuta TaxID=109671 RepID=UPI0027DB3F1A|nr:F-actin-uncapping protein LRRC16A-like isoform X2 [Physella acuta]
MATANTKLIPQDIQDSVKELLEKHVKITLKKWVKMEVRERLEHRVLALSSCRLFILSAKVPSKLENSYHFLEFQSIESKKPNQLTLAVENKTNFFLSDGETEDIDHIITHIGISLKQIFPTFQLDRLILKIDVQPVERLETMNRLIKGLENKEIGPCGGFTTMYQCMCDFHGLPFREEVAWDVDTIYLSHDCRELRLQDFDHLVGKDLVPIIGALVHNSWFKCINASNVKLSVEALNELIKVIKRNNVLEEVNLSNTGIKPEFLQKFSLAIISNKDTQLTSLDLSNNILDDKAVNHLLGAIKILPDGLTSFDISKTGVSTKCLNKVGEMLSQSPKIVAGLKSLKLSDNGLKGEDFPMLYNFLAQPNTLSYLDVSNTDCALDTLCDPLLRGCPNLKTLKASKTTFTHKKSREVIVPQSWKQFFATTCCLEYVDFSYCKLPPESIRDLLAGVSSNKILKELYLDISSNELGSAGASVLNSYIGSVKAIQGLDISNNGFDADLKVLLLELSKNSHIKNLSVGRNFSNIKPKFMPEVMTALTSLLQDDSVLEYLSLSESKLKADATYVINALGSNVSLLEIDISGNAIGDLGARMLAKALLINTKLQKVVWDKNNISAQGFEDVAEALRRNMTLKKMPFPVNDAAISLRLYPEKTEIALQKIEAYLQRNHSPRRFASDQAYRLQQGFLINSTQQMVDSLVVQVEDTTKALKGYSTLDVYAKDVQTAEKLVVEANRSRGLFPGLQDIGLKSQAVGNPIDTEFKSMADNLKMIIEKHMQSTIEEMFKCTFNNCPSVMQNQSLQAEIKEACLSKILLPKDFTKGVLEGASADVFNLIGEMNLSVAALMSDRVVEEVISSLAESLKSLSKHLGLRISGIYPEENQRESNHLDVPVIEGRRQTVLKLKTRPPSVIVHDKPSPLLLAPTPSPDEPTPQTLQHITKARPRREKAHRPTRPVVHIGSTELEEFPMNGFVPEAAQDSSTSNDQGISQSKTKQQDPPSKSDKSGPKKVAKEKDTKDGKKSIFNMFKKKAAVPAAPANTTSADAKPGKKTELTIDTKADEGLIEAPSKPENEILPPPTPKTPKIKIPVDRVAILPPVGVTVSQRTTSVTEGDSSSGVDEVKKDKPRGTEMKEDNSKHPQSLAKVHVALGGSTLFQEMKENQRFSKYMPSLDESKKSSNSLNETNNNEKERTDEGEEERLSLSKHSHQLTTSTSELHKNEAEHVDTAVAARPAEAFSSTSKLQPPHPRVTSGSRRPVSTVEEAEFVTDIPTCMTVSTPEVFFSDASGSKPKPPTKPRPAVLPRLKKGLSSSDDNTEVSSPTTPVAPSAANQVDTSECLRPASDSGVVYDSATLRLSVKDKIKRISQKSDSQSILPSNLNPTAVQKDDDQLKETHPKDPKEDMPLIEHVLKEDIIPSDGSTLTDEEKKEEIKPVISTEQDDEIMV